MRTQWVSGLLVTGGLPADNYIPVQAAQGLGNPIAPTLDTRGKRHLANARSPRHQKQHPGTSDNIIANQLLLHLPRPRRCSRSWRGHIHDSNIIFRKNHSKEAGRTARTTASFESSAASTSPSQVTCLRSQRHDVLRYDRPVGRLWLPTRRTQHSALRDRTRPRFPLRETAAVAGGSADEGVSGVFG